MSFTIHFVLFCLWRFPNLLIGCREYGLANDETVHIGIIVHLGTNRNKLFGKTNSIIGEPIFDRT